MATAYKGKYPGPDIFKGNKALNAAYKKQTSGKKLSEAARRKVAQSIYSSSQKKAAPKPAPKPAAAPATPKAPSIYPGANAGNTASNASGSIQLQSNHDLNMQELDARQAYDQEVEAANAQQESAQIANKQQQTDFDQQKLQDRTNYNTSLAFRGMTLGGVAATRGADLTNQWSNQQTAIDSQLSQANSSANTARQSAVARRNARLQQVNLGRQEFTNQQSKNSPTVGSKPQDAGVRATSVNIPKPAVTKPKTTTTAKKTYKGKYYGPDIFKGDKALNAAYSKQIKGRNLTDAAKRQIAQKIFSGR